MKRLLCGLLILYCGITQAAKVTVNLTTPDKNENGSALVDLVAVVVEWGSCQGTQFGERQAGFTVATTEVNKRLSVSIYPTGLTRVCVRAFAQNSKGVLSAASDTAWKDLLPRLGTPIILSQEN